MAQPWEDIVVSALETVATATRRVNRRARDDGQMQINNVYLMNAAYLTTGRHLVDSRAEEARDGKTILKPAVQGSSLVKILATKTPGNPGPLSDASPEVVTLTIEGQPRDALEYLGSPQYAEYLKYVTETDPDIEDIAGLKTELKPWQLVGKQLLCRMCNGPFRGAVLCDMTGMGKTLTSLCVGWRFLCDGPILVATKTSCVLQWYDEVQKHWNATHRPNVIILDDLAIEPEVLATYDIIITSHGFLRSRRGKQKAYDDYYDWLHAGGASAAKNIWGARRPARPANPLHGETWALLGMEFSLVIVDEIHEAQSQQSDLYQAIKSLRKKRLLGLTGTPIPNVLENIAGPLGLLPGSPFQDIQQFRRFGGAKTSEELAHRLERPTDKHSILFETLIAGIFLGRPKHLLGVPEKRDQPVAVSLDRDTKKLIKHHVDKGKWHLHRSHGGGPAARSQASHAWMRFHMAECASLSPILYQMAFDRFTERKKILREIAGEKRDIAELDARQEQLEAQPTVDDNEHRSQGRSPPVPQPGPSRSAADEAELLGAAVQYSPRDFRLAEKMAKQYREDYFYADDDKDADYTDEVEGNGADGEDDIDDLSDGGGDAEPCDSLAIDREMLRLNSDDLKDPRLKTKGRSDPGWTAAWLQQQLPSAPDAAVFSPRVEAILKTWAHIREHFPLDKTIIVADQVKYLDVLKEAIGRRAKANNLFAVDIAEYNGIQGSPSERAELLRAFNKALSGPNLLLLSAAAGGTGLNITGASHLINCAPYWTPGQDEQITGRVYRLPQDKLTHIYYVFSEDSTIDVMRRAACAERVEIGEATMFNIIRSHEAPYTAATLPTAKELQAASLSK